MKFFTKIPLPSRGGHREGSGRPANKTLHAHIATLHSRGMRAADIANQVGCNRATVYRVIKSLGLR